ncbi:MAG: hypothetical protein NTW19_08475 [Planctomycetota bacterium]|nr:hypothetical protein [Planctomycetota bacterium]
MTLKRGSGDTVMIQVVSPTAIGPRDPEKEKPNAELVALRYKLVPFGGVGRDRGQADSRVRQDMVAVSDRVKGCLLRHGFDIDARSEVETPTTCAASKAQLLDVWRQRADFARILAGKTPRSELPENLRALMRTAEESVRFLTLCRSNSFEMIAFSRQPDPITVWICDIPPMVLMTERAGVWLEVEG